MSRGTALVARAGGMNEQPQITADYTLDSVTRVRIARELHELIAALERRVPQVQRVGEVAIAKAASVLKDEALKRIDEIEREAPPGRYPIQSPGCVTPCARRVTWTRMSFR